MDNDIRAAIERTVPISLFNKGMAGKIFSDVNTSGAKVVIKNNSPECVLLSPDEYIRLMDEINDLRLYVIAEERMKNYSEDSLITQDEIYKRYGITEDMLSDSDEVEFE
jgi:PHD/YefM family antitoxin component YafN of YafNO toxin-antitoxin module